MRQGRTPAEGNTPAAEGGDLDALLGRMLANIDNLCEQLDKLKIGPDHNKDRVIGGRKW